MNQPTPSDLSRFEDIVSRLRENESGCMRMAGNFNLGGGKTYRSHQMYWYLKYGSWPGRLKKSCTTEGCVTHYEEKGHVLTPNEVEEIREAKEYWGVVTDLSKKFGVSKARISQIRSAT